MLYNYIEYIPILLKKISISVYTCYVIDNVFPLSGLELGSYDMFVLTAVTVLNISINIFCTGLGKSVRMPL